MYLKMAGVKYSLVILFTSCFLWSFLRTADARIHKLNFEDDKRDFILVSSFGFNKGGYLEVSVTNFTADPMDEKYLFGFSLDRTISDAVNSFTESHTREGCVLGKTGSIMQPENLSSGLVLFKFDFAAGRVVVKCSSQLQGLGFYLSTDSIPKEEVHPVRKKKKASLNKKGDKPMEGNPGLIFRRRRSVEAPKPEPKLEEPASEKDVCDDLIIPLNSTGLNSFSTKFVVYIKTEKEEGRYHLYFHNCENYLNGRSEATGVFVAVNLDMTVVELNGEGNFLSAGEMPLPPLFFMMAVLFFFVGIFWIFILRKSKSTVFKIHYLMAALVFAKALSLLFHGINYHYIELSGTHVEAWAVLYYIMHLMKGALLFITIVLIGSGWAFIKGILSDKEKKIFMIVIPLQVLSNVAMIIFEESEESEVGHSLWNEILILVDLLCCGAILLPVVWSIRHLQEAAETDGKAAINLKKLVLFRHFYVMIVCYIYSTRIIVYLLKITLPFNYAWLDDMFREMATFVFFVMTGYKFRPASSNPYLQLPQEEDEEAVDEAITQTGLTATLTRHGRGNRTVLDDSSDSEDRADLYDAMELVHTNTNRSPSKPVVSKREASHDYD